MISPTKLILSVSGLATIVGLAAQLFWADLDLDNLQQLLALVCYPMFLKLLITNFYSKFCRIEL